MDRFEFNRNLPGVGVSLHLEVSIWFAPLLWMLEFIRFGKITWLAVGPISFTFAHKDWTDQDVSDFHGFYEDWSNLNKWGISLNRGQDE